MSNIMNSLNRKLIAKVGSGEFSSAASNEHLLAAANRILDATNMLTEWVGIPYTPAIVEYPLVSSDECLCPMRLMSARVNDTEVDLGAEYDELDATMDPDGAYVEIHSVPELPGTGGLFGSCGSGSEAQYPIALEFSLQLSPDACDIPELLYKRHYDLIVTGAAGMMHTMMGMPWSSASRAGAHTAAFEGRIATARQDAVLDRTARNRSINRARNTIIVGSANRSFC